jgi:hypothetical protein
MIKGRCFLVGPAAGLHLVQRNGRESQVHCIRLQLHVMNEPHGKKKLGLFARFGS